MTTNYLCKSPSLESPLKHKSGLYKLRNFLRILSPLYISICAAMFMEIREPLRFENTYVSLLYFASLASFVLAMCIAYILTDRCDRYRTEYNSKYERYMDNPQGINEPNPVKIYSKGENGEPENIRKKLIHRFQYCAVVLFGIVGLTLLSISYKYSNKSQNGIEKQEVRFEHQIDSLHTAIGGQTLQIAILKQKIDSISSIDQSTILAPTHKPQHGQTPRRGEEVIAYPRQRTGRSSSPPCWQ